MTEESLNGLKRSMYCGEVRPEHTGLTITVMGWVQKTRNKGSLIFLDIRDREGLVQVVLSQETADPALFEKAASLRTEYVVAVTGKVQKREGAVNEKLATGEVEIKADDLENPFNGENHTVSDFGRGGYKRGSALKVPLSGPAPSENAEKSQAETSDGDSDSFVSE